MNSFQSIMASWVGLYEYTKGFSNGDHMDSENWVLYILCIFNVIAQSSLACLFIWAAFNLWFH